MIGWSTVAVADLGYCEGPNMAMEQEAWKGWEWGMQFLWEYWELLPHQSLKFRVFDYLTD